MKKMADYIFFDSWQTNELSIKPNVEYLVLNDLGDLRKGELVKFIGFDDVDNHFGIFVFLNSEGGILEVSGDFSGSNHSCMKDLKLALSKV